MNTQDILKVATDTRKAFQTCIQNEPYQLRGIFTSEALLMVSIIKALDVKSLVESGRARGYSTKLFARFFASDPTFNIVSIDFDRSEDTHFSEQELAPFKNVRLLYGDARILVPKEITAPCVVFIDGPKGDEALLLAATCIKNPLVRAVFVHDLHQSTFHRNIAEMLFTKTFFSDDADFVSAHKDLDAPCWDMLKDHGEVPYVRKGKKMQSYASTVAVFFGGNDAVRNDVLENYTNYYAHRAQRGLKKTVREYVARHPKLARPAFELYRKIKSALHL